MPHKRSSRKIGFIDALGQWTMDPSLRRRSTHCRRRPKSTAASREARLANAPPDLHLTAAEWRRYADIPPKPQGDCNCTDCEDEYSDSDEENDDLRPLPAPQLHPEKTFSSAWSHSTGSAATRTPTAVPRDSGLNRMLGRVPSNTSEEQRLRHKVSYDADNDALFANIPHRDSRNPGEIIVHRHRLGDGDDHLNVETFGNPHRDANVQSVRSSQFFLNPRDAPAAPPPARDTWPRALQHIPENAQTRIQSWRDSVTGQEMGSEPSVFGGSNVTVWPGVPGSGETVVPDDSLTEVVRRRSHRSHGGRSEGGGRRYSKRK
ncbi:hypothetical protein FBEOM_8078 [Fusarium beomiforme]|uniref:Uncharacterized protein n=1 Tax=Fusarium beomiforme TaxID=44412 RepID=A0A9P5AFU3_9HYPO|nr:hypothetical protein FBEOM_8078 [Fusarium beomiforme]